MQALLPPVLALLAIAGVILGRRQDRTELARLIFRTIYRVNLPLLICVIAAAPLTEAGAAMGMAIAVCAVVTCLAALYAHLFVRDRGEQAAFTLSVLWANTGWLGIPLCAAILGPEAVPAAVLYTVALSPFHFSVGGTVAAAGGDHRRNLWQALKANTALIPALVGVAWALSGIPHSELLADVGAHLAIVTSVPAFLALGLVLARARLRPDRNVAAAVTMRVVLSPLLLASAALLVAMPRAFLVQAGMATGMNTLTLASEHGLPLNRVASAVAWSTAVAVTVAMAWVALA